MCACGASSGVQRLPSNRKCSRLHIGRDDHEVPSCRQAGTHNAGHGERIGQVLDHIVHDDEIHTPRRHVGGPQRSVVELEIGMQCARAPDSRRRHVESHDGVPPVAGQLCTELSFTAADIRGGVPNFEQRGLVCDDVPEPRGPTGAGGSGRIRCAGPLIVVMIESLARLLVRERGRIDPIATARDTARQPEMGSAPAESMLG